MVKLVSPLHSYEARGKFGDIVYTGKTARHYTKATQANSTAQGNTRQAFKAAQKALSLTGPQVRTHLEATLGKKWYAVTLGEILGEDLTRWQDSASAFALFAPADQTNWDDEAEGIGLSDTSIEYAGDAPISAGLALYAVARVLHKLAALTPTPTASNPDTITPAYIA